jgi:hypothetical protein
MSRYPRRTLDVVVILVRSSPARAEAPGLPNQTWRAESEELDLSTVGVSTLALRIG